MSSMVSPKVIVLWDLETTVLSNHSAPDAVAAVRKLALQAKGGEIRKINAYWRHQSPASNNLNPSSSNANQRGFQDYLDALRLNGINVIDTVFLGGAESTAKALIVDMFLEMVDASKAPPILLVISDNPAMQYPISLLTNRHRVVYLIPSTQLETVVQSLLVAKQTDGDPGPLVSGLRVPSDSDERANSKSESQVGRSDDATTVGSLNSPITSGIGGGIGRPQEGQVRRVTNRQDGRYRPYNNSRQLSSNASERAMNRPQNRTTNIPPEFITLVEVLDLAREQGNTKLDKAKLGNMLSAKSKTLYRDAGFKDFKRYIAAAELSGIINIEGGGTEAYVSLKIQDENPWAGVGSAGSPVVSPFGNSLGSGGGLGVGIWN